MALLASLLSVCTRLIFGDLVSLGFYICFLFLGKWREKRRETEKGKGRERKRGMEKEGGGERET